MKLPKIFQRQAPKPAAQPPPAPQPEPIRIYYSAKERGFFHSHIHGKNLPRDAKPIPESLHKACLLAQERGEEIVPDATGMPVTRARVVDRRIEGRRRATNALRGTDWMVARHRDQVELHAKLSITPTEYAELLEYRQAMREWPSRPDFPAGEPPRPDFLKP